MSYGLSFSRRAASYLRRLDAESQMRITRVVRALCEDPLAHGSKPLRDPAGRRSVRIGTWRVVYFVDEAATTLHVDLIGPRGDVYRGL